MTIMLLNNEHAIIGWMIIIGAICLTIVLGAVLDRLMHNKRQSSLRVAPRAVRVSNSKSQMRRFNRR